MNELDELKAEIRDLFDLSKDLKGEDAIEQVWLFFECPNDKTTGELALQTTMRFYFMARYLTERIGVLFKKGGIHE